MDLSEFILEVATTYDRTDGLDTPTQRLLREAHVHLAEHCPTGIEIVGSGGKGVPTFTPWIGFFDPDETTSPQYGVYVVYLFSEDLEHVTLTLNQGIERLRQNYGSKAAREVLVAEASAVRALLRPELLRGLDVRMSLGSKGDRQAAYEAGNIASRTYESGSLPPEGSLRADLHRVLAVYRSAVVSRQDSLVITSDRRAAGAEDASVGALLAGFRPKNSDDYVARLTGKTLTKSRSHEQLVRDFGEHAMRQAFTATTPHPRDLTLQKDGHEWLVEAKVVYQGNATNAVRAAIGQLFTYRHFFYEDGAAPALIALFSEPVGGAYCALLESLGIGSVWRKQGSWGCSASVGAAGLVAR